MRAGKLQFLLVTAAFGGKLAKGAPHALRAAGCRRRRSTVEGALRASIAFISTILPLLPVRRLRLRDILRAAARSPVVVWSDAMWDMGSQAGGLGFVVWFPPGLRGRRPPRPRPLPLRWPPRCHR